MAEDPGYSLIRAVREGNVQTAKQLIDNFGLSHSKAWSSGYNLLRDALEYKQEEVTKLLLKSGSKINSKSKRPSWTPLHFAVKNGYTDIVAMLLERRANVNAKDQLNETPLHCAVDQGSLEIVKLLMKHKAKSMHGITALYRAVKNGNLAIVEELLNHGVQINSCAHSFGKGFMPLHCAAAQGNVAMVELLLRKSAEVNITSRDKRTPLHVAAFMRQDKVAKLLLERGANVNTRDKDGKTALHVAVAEGHLPTVEQILLFRPDVQSEANRNSLYAAINDPLCINAKAIVDALLRYGFTVSAEDAKNIKLLHTAVERGYLKVVDALLNFGADVNAHDTAKKGVTPLHIAALHCQREVAELLLSNGANVNAKDSFGKSAVYYAIENRDEEITKVLLLSGTSGVEITKDILYTAVKKECRNIVEMLLKGAPKYDVNECDKLGRTALHHTVLDDGWDFSPIVFFPAKKGATENKDLLDARVEMAKLFLSRGARVNAKTKNGTTALHYAAKGGYVNVVELLLKNQADVNSLAEHRTSPLHSAAKGDNKLIVKMLLDSGANVNARQNNGTTALHIASKSGHEEIVNLLVQRGAGLDTKDNGKVTPLYFAIVSGYSDVVETLLKLGANVEAKDKSGRTALHVAAKHGWPTIAELLLNYGANINVTCMESMTPLNYATLGTDEYNNRHAQALFGRRFEYDDDDDDDDYFDLCPHDEDFFSDPDHDDFYDYFADDYESVSDCPYQGVAEILEQHIVRMKALDLYVSEKNLRAVDLQFEHRNMLEQCQMEIAKMKSKKIGDSSVSFHDILTRGMNQLAVYARNESIVRVFESEDYFFEFPSYCGMIDRRFKQGQKRESLLSSSLKSLIALSGYVLPDLTANELFYYLSNKDLENLIGADPNADECES